MSTWECGICAGDYDEEVEPHYADGTPVCLDCVTDELVPKFKAALQHEELYPPPWGDAFLDVTAFEDVLGSDFVAKYEAKEKLYAVPIRLRRYCKHRIDGQAELCNTILLPPRPELPDEGANLTCSSCEKESCPRCEAPIDPQTPHECTIIGPTADQETGLEGLIRGQDYQFCPNERCGVPVQLSEACNHMTCNQPRCRTEFCFLCGDRATVPSGHWNPGMPCPLYGVPELVQAWTKVRDALDLPLNPSWDTLPPIVLVNGSERQNYEDDLIMHFDLLLDKMADWTRQNEGTVPPWMRLGLREQIWATVSLRYSANSGRIRRAIVSALHPLDSFHLRVEEMDRVFWDITAGARDFINDHMELTARMMRSIERHVEFTPLTDLERLHDLSLGRM